MPIPDAIRYGITPETEVVISARPITLSAQVGINESALGMAEPPEEEGSGYDHADYGNDHDDDDDHNVAGAYDDDLED